MLKFFKDAEIYDGDCYVADFTDQTDSERGVEFSREPFGKIDCFHLKKEGKLPVRYQAINIEEYGADFSKEDNCECVFNSLSPWEKPWLLFVETKYCHKPENIDNYSFKAYTQMYATMEQIEKLTDMRREERKIYFVYSVPPFSEAEPFGSFAITHNDILRMYDEEEGIIMMGFNTILIMSPTRLRKPRTRI